MWPNCIVTVAASIMLFSLLSLGVLLWWCIVGDSSLTTTSSLYDKYLRLNGKSLARLADPSRLQRFVDSAVLVFAHNRHSTARYRLRLTSFADWLDAELGEMFSTRTDSSLRRSSSLSWTSPKLHGFSQSELLQDLLGVDTDYLWDILMDTVSQNSNNNNANDNVKLNWATEENPLATKLTSAVYDQRGCGACWAFVSVSMTEAAVTRSWAIQQQQQHQQRLRRSPSLSAQELLDCDVQFDRGCSGGNPFYALAFIREHGLVSSQQYPFRGMVKTHTYTTLS
jgi:hypothetical protein